MKSTNSKLKKNKTIAAEFTQKEISFYKETGIETDFESISKYIEFKEKLGLNINWRQIKEIQKHLDLSGEEIKIKLTKVQRQYSRLTLVCFAVFTLCGVWLAGHPNQYNIDWLADSLKAQFLFLTPVLLGYILVTCTAESILTAQMIERRIIA